MPKSVKSVFTTLSKNLKRLAREGDPVAFLRYARSSEFREGLGDLDPSRLQTVLDLYAQARESCYANTPLITQGTRAFIRWDAPRIAKLRKAWLETGCDEGVARICGLTRKAARIALKRHVWASESPDQRQAA
jgi:hypothetical protein